MTDNPVDRAMARAGYEARPALDEGVSLIVHQVQIALRAVAWDKSVTAETITAAISTALAEGIVDAVEAIHGEAAARAYAAEAQVERLRELLALEPIGTVGPDKVPWFRHCGITHGEGAVCVVCEALAATRQHVHTPATFEGGTACSSCGATLS